MSVVSARAREQSGHFRSHLAFAFARHISQYDPANRVIACVVDAAPQREGESHACRQTHQVGEVGEREEVAEVGDGAEKGEGRGQEEEGGDGGGEARGELSEGRADVDGVADAVAVFVC